MMVSCDGDQRQRSGSRESLEDDPPSESTVPVEQQQEDDGVWAASEGYTPLMGEGTMVFSTGPDDEQEGGSADYATLPSPPVAGFPSSGRDDDDETSDSEKKSEQGEGTDDFRRLADTALSSLELEYQRTLAQSSVHSSESALAPTEDDSQFAAALFDHGHPSDQERQEDNTNEGDSKVSSSLTEDTSQTVAEPSLTATAKKEVPDIDTDAVRRAVQAIGLRDPALQNNFAKWQDRQKAPRSQQQHDLIPKGPMAAFGKNSPKAVEATANLTRAATLAEAWIRNKGSDSSTVNNGEANGCVLHILGCDKVECESVETIQRWFSPFVRWMGAASAASTIQLHLVGPNVPLSMASAEPVNLLPKQQQQGSSTTHLKSAQAFCHSTVYDEWDDATSPPDMVAAFNAGIWGYDEWKATIQQLMQKKQPVPFVVTSYTIQEAEDDFDVLQQQVAAALGDDNLEQVQERCVLWKPELNPFASRKERVTATAPPGRCYRENSAWQAWRLGCVEESSTTDNDGLSSTD